MLPSCPNAEYLYSVPKFDMNRGDIKDFMNELKGFHEQFYDCFQRSESREHFFKFMAGQLSDLERKSIEPIALAIENGNVRAMQRFVSDAPWADVNIAIKYRSLVNDDLGSPDGVLIFDESGCIKKRDDSVGVARQYCGNVGKVDNCQVGVFAAYASENGYALVDKRLFIPEKWFSDDYAARRRKCKLPEDTVFRTKPQLAAEMLREIDREKLLPFKYVLGDSIYGMSPEFISAVESLPAIQLFHQQRILRRSAENACLAQRHALGHRAVFRGNQDRAGHGPLRGEKVHGLASPHSNVHDGSLFPLAPENQDGKKSAVHYAVPA